MSFPRNEFWQRSNIFVDNLWLLENCNNMYTREYYLGIEWSNNWLQGDVLRRYVQGSNGVPREDTTYMSFLFIKHVYI